MSADADDDVGYAPADSLAASRPTYIGASYAYAMRLHRQSLAAAYVLHTPRSIQHIQYRAARPPTHPTSDANNHARDSALYNRRPTTTGTVVYDATLVLCPARATPRASKNTATA